MVALQILVLIVGVRILLGELSADFPWSAFFICEFSQKTRCTSEGQNVSFVFRKFGSFEYRFSSSPSQGGETGSTPVGARSIQTASCRLKLASLQGKLVGFTVALLGDLFFFFHCLLFISVLCADNTIRYFVEFGRQCGHDVFFLYIQPVFF